MLVYLIVIYVAVIVVFHAFPAIVYLALWGLAVTSFMYFIDKSEKK